MSRLLGFAFIASGVAVGGLALALERTSPHPERSILTFGVTEIPKAAQTPADEARTPSGGQALLSGQRPALKPVGMVRAEDARRPVLQPEARRPIPSFQTTTVFNEPVALTRSLQRELARVGCYTGAINGIWTTASRAAMKSFNQRMNARLPVAKPDQVLLALVKAQKGQVCGAGCPQGQMHDARGRCLPAVLVARTPHQQGPTRTAAVETPPSATVRDLPPPTLMLGLTGPVDGAEFDTPRMGLAGPLPADVKTRADEAPAAHREAKKPRKREHEARPRKPAAYGQTRWAREFWANHGSGG